MATGSTESTERSHAWGGSLHFTSSQQKLLATAAPQDQGPCLRALTLEEPHILRLNSVAASTLKALVLGSFTPYAMIYLILCPGTHPTSTYSSNPTQAQRSIF